jgi:PAS domain S-box-containing protein
LTPVGNAPEPRVDPSALFGAIVQSADDAITSIDLNEIITSWNRAAQQLYGYEAKDVIGVSNRLIIPPDRHAEEDDVVRRLTSGEGVQHLDTVRVRKDGSRIDVAITASAIYQDGRIIGISKIARDISERKNAERNGARLAAIVESSDDAIVSKDLNGTITSWNHAAERMFGFTADEAIGNSIRLIIPADHQHEEDTILDRIRRGQSVHFETIRRRKDGASLPISVTVSPIRNKAGTVIGASKIARDISERRRAEALAQRVQQEAEFVVRMAELLSRPLDYEARLRGLVEMIVPRWLTGQPSTLSSPMAASAGSRSRIRTRIRPSSVPRSAALRGPDHTLQCEAGHPHRKRRAASGNHRCRDCRRSAG